ncbi:Putative Pyruvate-formate lyase-activating enzyme [Avibacterium paragallinarum JF4211]|nr:Putative Pyruvate-formate lyase-activating enzyme [Avibacterium paragallinarum JF4211]
MNSVPFIRGITVSGGEPTIHHKKLVPFFTALRKQGLTCYLDSSGFFDYDSTQELISVTDKFLFDLKGDGLGLQTLCFERRNQQGKMPNQIIPTKQHIKTENLTRNWQNLAKLLPHSKIEEVRLVFIKDFFDAYHLVEKAAQLLRDYPDGLFKIIRVHRKGARDEAGLTPFIPTVEETQALAAFAKLCGMQKVITII